MSLSKILLCWLKVLSSIIFIILISSRLILVLSFSWFALLKLGCVLYSRASYIPSNSFANLEIVLFLMHFKCLAVIKTSLWYSVSAELWVQHTHTHIYIYTHTHTYIYTCTHTHTHIYMHTHTHTYIYIYWRTHTYIYLHTSPPYIYIEREGREREKGNIVHKYTLNNFR